MALRLWRWTKWDAVGKYTRAYPTRDSASVGHWPSGSPQENRDPANSGAGVPPQGTRAPSGGGVGNDSEGQKQAVLAERPTKPLPPTHSPGMAPLSPFYPALWARTDLVWSRRLSLLQTQLYTANGTRRHSGGDTLTLWGVRRGDTGPFARLGRGGLRLAREDTVAFPQEPAE